MAIFKKIITSESVESMNCKEVRLFIPLFVLGGREMTLDEWFALDDHIQFCPRCAKEYEETRFIVELVEHHRTDLINKGLFSESVKDGVGRELTDEENLQEILDKVERSEARRRHNRNIKRAKHFLKASAAIAACLVIGVLTWMVFSDYSKPHVLLQNSSSQQVIPVLKPSVKVELVANAGNISISSGEQITSTGQSKTLLINGKHKMLMNTNTILAVEPLVKNSNIGCLVKLDSGQIYTHVEHDGNPFIVETSNAKSVITGTTFDVKVTDDGTTLVVSEGTVRFESEEGSVKVAAGQTSEIVGQSIPTNPLSCNTAELTAWATGYKPGPVFTESESNTDLWELPLSFGKEPIVPEETDYEHWVEQKRGWFKQEFPWIFQLKEALAEKGIETDYPELLIKSGDVWQFVCLETTPTQFSVIDPNSLIKTASHYGFDKQYLLENIPAAKDALEKPALSKSSFASLRVFEKWGDGFQDAQKTFKELDASILFYSLHAATYLENTRSLVWLIAHNASSASEMENRSQLLLLLQKEVNVANNCVSLTFELMITPQKSCSTKYKDSLKQMTKNINLHGACEQKLSKYKNKKGLMFTAVNDEK